MAYTRFIYLSPLTKFGVRNMTTSRESERNAEYEKAVEIATGILRVLLTEDSVVSFIEGELKLKEGELMEAYKTLSNTRR